MPGKIKLIHRYQYIISLENLLKAWQEFVKGKRNKPDVQSFERHLSDNIVFLRQDLVDRTYCHSAYQAFRVFDPKPRQIHKALVRDRLLHHAIYRVLYPFFDRTFMADSYSCRLNKGTHKAINQFKEFGNIVSHNNTRTCWVLKCDVRKFFASIDQLILHRILSEYIPDLDILWLLDQVISSFNSGQLGKGLPLGNLTSQLFCNVYMNEFDQYVKHRLKAKYYIRYADDFVIMSSDKKELEERLIRLSEFLSSRLKLNIHQNKVMIKTLASGVDWLGYVHWPKYRVLRTSTKRRMFRNLQSRHHLNSVNRTTDSFLNSSLQSYLGLLRHSCNYKLSNKIKQMFGYDLL